MKKVSTKQAQKNRELARINAQKPDFCIVCGMPIYRESDLMHLLPKSIYGKYYTEPMNLWKAHRGCHRLYDDHKLFRMQQKHIIDIVRTFASEQEINQYFT